MTAKLDAEIRSTFRDHPGLPFWLRTFRMQSPTIADVPARYRPQLIAKAKQHGVQPNALLRRAWEMR